MERLMSVSKDQVRHVAKLARIAMTDEDLAPMTGEINGVLDWIEQLAEVDVTNVPPMTSVVEAKLKERQDEVADGGYPDKVLANAPQREDFFFTVPKVVE
jgi:aspartyl-tRNA(Asn)/glutamyl-tRNA(Gln) amidotransferase subunit C